MPKPRQWSRREFLIAATLLAGCAPRTVVKIVEVTSTPSPTSTPPPPTQTPEPTATVTTLVEPGGFDMVLVEAGSFQMGSASGGSNEQPVHTVNLTQSFYVSKHEVTFDQYDEFCDSTDKTRLDDSGWGRGDQPVNVTWYDAAEYCNWLSERAGLTPCYSGRAVATEWDLSTNGYRLPTEAEWEYAARGGSRSQGYVYAGSNDPDEVGWYEGNSGGRPHPVGQKAPNELGLYDMSGNLWEWCWDWYDKEYYASSPSDDPRGPAAPSDRMMPNKVRRGSGWYHEVGVLHMTYRSYDWANYRSNSTGFRLVRTA
jgi:formylglycine-generating enzyme required for sulfatase activity